MPFAKADGVHVVHKIFIKTVVLESPVVHILASSVAHANYMSEFTNESMQSAFMRVTSTAIQMSFQACV